MSTKETLRMRKDIPDEHVEKLVARAAELQHQSKRTNNKASESDIEAVANELNIDSKYVEAAIKEWRQEETHAPERSARNRVKNRGRAFLKGLLIITGVATIGGPLLGWALWKTLGSTVFFTVAGGIAAIIAGIIWLLS